MLIVFDERAAGLHSAIDNFRQFDRFLCRSTLPLVMRGTSRSS